MGCLSSTSVTEIVNDGEEGDVQNQSICIVESELGGLVAGWLALVGRTIVKRSEMDVGMCVLHSVREQWCCGRLKIDQLKTKRPSG